MDELVSILLPFVPVVLALVEWFKLFVVDSKYYPFISMSLGVVFGLLVITANAMPTTYGEWVLAVIAGILLGLTASGLYMVGDSLSKKIGKG